MLAPISLDGLTASQHWIGATVTHTMPSVVETTSAPWGYSATLRLAALRQLHRCDSGWLFWEIDAEVLLGAVGFGLIDGDKLGRERLLAVVHGRRKVYLQAVEIEADLMVRNGPNSGVSRVAIYSVVLVHQGPLELDEAGFLMTPRGR
jgi:hypothetical protein